MRAVELVLVYCAPDIWELEKCLRKACLQVTSLVFWEHHEPSSDKNFTFAHRRCVLELHLLNAAPVALQVVDLPFSLR